MSHLRRNVVANFVGKGCAIAANIAFVPLYLKLMGLDAAGLIGFNVTLTAAVQLMDLGLSTTLNREMARLAIGPSRAQEARNLVRTLEIVYWPLALVAAAGIAILAPLIALHWFSSHNLTPQVVQRAVLMMGVSIAFQWPYSLYEGALLGLQRQVLVNIITTTATLLRTGGALLVLLAMGKTIEVYFGWQIVVSAAMTIAVFAAAWRALPAAALKPGFNASLLRGIRGYAGGVMGASVAAFAVSQCDRIILSRQLSLDFLGCYTTAAQIAGMLLYATGPLFTALFPQFVQLIALDKPEELKHLYHRSCQLVSVVVVPSAVVLALYAPELTRVLEAWSGKPLHIAHTSDVLTLLVIGNALNGLVSLPFALQLAHGWTRLALWQNIVTLTIQIPLTLWLVKRWGAPGAAAVWMLVNLAYLVFLIPLMHRKILPGEARRWFVRDVGAPLALALLIAGMARLWRPGFETMWAVALRVVLIGFVTFVGCLIAFPAGWKRVKASRC